MKSKKSQKSEMRCSQIFVEKKINFKLAERSPINPRKYNVLHTFSIFNFCI